MHLRFDNGARGHLWNTTIAPGNENGLGFRVHGSGGGLSWHQEHPNRLRFAPTGRQPRILTRGGFETSASADAATRVPAGHPEGYLEAFANLYAEIADLLQPDGAAARARACARRSGTGARGGLHARGPRVEPGGRPLRAPGVRGVAVGRGRQGPSAPASGGTRPVDTPARGPTIARPA